MRDARDLLAGARFVNDLDAGAGFPAAGFTEAFLVAAFFVGAVRSEARARFDTESSTAATGTPSCAAV